MDNSSTIFITGSPGVGKTTIANILLKKGYSIFNIGSLMTDIAIKEGLVKDRDEIRALNVNKSTKLREMAAKHISNEEGIKIVDTQISVAHNGRYAAGIPINLMNKIKDLRLIIYIDATEKEILARRSKDNTRIREHESNEFIDIQRSINMGILSYYSVHLNIPIYVIHKIEDDIENTVIKCEDALKSI